MIVLMALGLTLAILAGFYLLIAALGRLIEDRWLFDWPLDLLADLGLRRR